MSCGSSTPQTRKAQPAPAPEPVYDDAFASFDGTPTPLGEQVTLRREPVGLAEPRALVALGRTEWVIHTLAGGGEEKTATASLVVQRGGEAGNVRIEAGESGTVLGVTIEVHEAGEVYEESSMRWVQFAKVTFSVAP
jgi:hypothetical protein